MTDLNWTTEAAVGTSCLNCLLAWCLRQERLIHLSSSCWTLQSWASSCSLNCWLVASASRMDQTCLWCWVSASARELGWIAENESVANCPALCVWPTCIWSFWLAILIRQVTVNECAVMYCRKKFKKSLKHLKSVTGKTGVETHYGLTARKSG